MSLHDFGQARHGQDNSVQRIGTGTIGDSHIIKQSIPQDDLKSASNTPAQFQGTAISGGVIKSLNTMVSFDLDYGRIVGNDGTTNRVLIDGHFKISRPGVDVLSAGPADLILSSETGFLMPTGALVLIDANAVIPLGWALSNLAAPSTSVKYIIKQ